MQTQLKNIRERKKEKRFDHVKKKRKMRLHYENLEKLLYCKSKIFPVIFATVKLRLYCRKDVFFERFLVFNFNHSHLLE